MSSPVYQTDVLVVGGGLAGCWAAIRASEVTPNVTLVDKAIVARSGITLYCHDMLGPMPEAEADDWLKDVVEHAEYMSDQRYAEDLLREHSQRVRQMEDFGVPFERDEKGALVLGLGRGHVTSRVILYDGRKLMEAMREEVLRRKINLVERTMVVDLLTSDGCQPTKGSVVGALGVNTRSGEFTIFRAGAVILTSSIMTAKLHLGFNDNLTGDGQAMAWRAGAQMSGLELLFNPNYTCPHKGGVVGSAGLIQFQTLDAQLVNSRGERFMDRYSGDLRERRSNFGILAQAIAKELIEGRGPVYFDMRHFGKEKFERVRRIIPITMASLEAAGIDPEKELVPCRPVIGYFGASGSGGIRINHQGETNLPGLLAAGAAAACPGYSIPLSGGFTTFCNVSGYRAGQRAAQASKEMGPGNIDNGQLERLKQRMIAPLKRSQGISPGQIYRRINSKLVILEFGIFKTEESIRTMLEEIREIARTDLPEIMAVDNHEMIKAKEARNYVELLEPIYLAALARRECRLTHLRADHPYRDDAEWLKWIVAKKEDGEIKLAYVQVPVEEGKIKPPVRTRVPSSIFQD
jgi:succinate dehydrogenase/fumarate reductase flavoprotein subunit